MIQRIQTIFLLGVAACMVAMLFFQTWAKTDTATGDKVILSATYSAQITEGQDPLISNFPYTLVGIFAVLAALVAVLEIFKYKNRLMQIKLGALNSLLMSASLGATMYFSYTLNDAIMPEVHGEYDVGLYFPALGLLFNIMANRFIRRDERLVRSVDRIR